MPITALLLAAAVLSGAEVSNADAAALLREDRAAFRAADRNGDGRIDDRELERFRRALADAAPAADGPVTSGALSRIGDHDYDGDGALTPAELYFGVPRPGS